MSMREPVFPKIAPIPAGLLVLPILIGLLISAPYARAQSAPPAPGTAGSASAAPTPGGSGAPATGFEPLPRGFRGVELGMTLEEVEKALRADDLFFYRGGPDVTLLPRPDEKLLEVQGLSYVKRAFFQFYEDKLFSAIYVLNTDKIDHYSIFTQFSKRYGKPNALSPEESVWADGAVRVSIERPLTVKYVDMAVMEQLKRAGEVRQSYEETARQDFIGSF